MKTGIILVFVIMGQYAMSVPINDDKGDISSCIEMTTPKVKQIQKIVGEINSFIQRITDQNEDIDFTLFQIKIEQHNDNESVEKETVLSLIINDCKNINGTKTIMGDYNLNGDLETSDEDDDISDEEGDNLSTTSKISKKYITSKSSKFNDVLDENDSVTKTIRRTKARTPKTGDNDQIDSNPQEISSEPAIIETQVSIPVNDDIQLTSFKDIIDKKLGESGNLFIYAPNYDNSKVDIKNDNDGLYKDLYENALQKIANLEIELEITKQAKTVNFVARPDRKSVYDLSRSSRIGGRNIGA